MLLHILSFQPYSMSTATVKRQIGDATFPAIGYGVMGLSVAYGPALPDEERFKVGQTGYRWRLCANIPPAQVLDGVYESGLTHWDTADVYLDSEHLIGQWYVRHPSPSVCGHL